MRSLKIFKIKSQEPGTKIVIEPPDFFRKIQRLFGKNAYRGKINAIGFQHFDPMNNLVKCALSRSVHAVSIVNPPWSINTDPDFDLPAVYQVTPLLVDQRGIGLKPMLDPGRSTCHPLDKTEGSVIKANRHGKRLPRMPCEYKWIYKAAGFLQQESA